MWQLALDILFWTFNTIGVAFTLLIVVEPIWDAISKRVRSKRNGNMGAKQ